MPPSPFPVSLLVGNAGPIGLNPEIMEEKEAHNGVFRS